jgi:hypothetical protein
MKSDRTVLAVLKFGQVVTAVVPVVVAATSRGQPSGIDFAANPLPFTSQTVGKRIA